jgi:hypothetical protein
MLKPFVITSFVMSLFATSATSASAQWENLGSKEVTDRAESDTLRLATEGQFRSLRFRVTRSPVRFYHMDVIYGNGETDRITLRSLIMRRRVLHGPADRNCAAS